MSAADTSIDRARIIGVDICRSFAISGAMASHCMIHARVFENVSPAVIEPLRFFLQLAPPIFIGLFGAMLEVAYVRKFQSGRAETGSAQLMARAAQCYLLYALSVSVLMFTGQISFGYFARCLLLIGATPYTDILKFYAIVLACGPFLIAFRLRFGLGAVIGAAVAIQSLYPLLKSVQPPIGDENYWRLPASFFLGIGNSVGGPSLLHGLSFVLIGMMLGRSSLDVISEDKLARRRGHLAFALTAGIAGILTLASWDWHSPSAMVRAIADMVLRNDNHPIYFLLGVATTSTATWIALWLYDRRRIQVGRQVDFLAKSSLFTFSFGNAWLYALPRGGSEGWSSLAYAATLFAIILVQSVVFVWITKALPNDTSRRGRLARWQKATVGTIASCVKHPSQWLYATAQLRSRRAPPEMNTSR